MHARIGRVTFSADQADQAVSHVRENVIPKLQEQDGFKGFTLLIDRSGGQGIGVSFWESEDALRATHELADQVRGGVAQAVGGSDEGQQSFEVAIDTMA
jgi:heme-degrading monooxygenase HmoA